MEFLLMRGAISFIKVHVVRGCRGLYAAELIPVIANAASFVLPRTNPQMGAVLRANLRSVGKGMPIYQRNIRVVAQFKR
jgi:hypothetical protein